MSRYYDDYAAREHAAPVVGHKVSGGGATINNSPINIHLHINVTEGMRLEDDAGRPTEAGRTLSFLAQLFRGRNNGKLEDGRLHEGAGQIDIGGQDFLTRLDVVRVRK